jgi:hypothetical protein
MVTASNNPNPEDPFYGYVQSGGYSGTAKDLDNAIKVLALPDGFIKTTALTKTGNEISISPLDFKWRLNQTEYVNSDLFTRAIRPAAIGYNRIDIIVATIYSAFVLIEGEENLYAALEPPKPEGTLKAAFVSVFGEEIAVDYIPNDMSPPPPFGTFEWVMRGSDHDGRIPIAGDRFQGMISATEFSDSLIWNGIGELNISNLSNFNILNSTEITL